MHHQRYRHQRKQLVEAVQSHQIRGKGNPKNDTISHRIEEKKYFLVLLLRHIGKSVERRQRPQHTDQTGKHHAHAVHMETDGEISRNMRQRKDTVLMMQQQIPHQHTIQNDQALQKNLPM